MSILNQTLLVIGANPRRSINVDVRNNKYIVKDHQVDIITPL